MRLNKERIRQRFARAARTYDNQAVIQLQVAERIVSLLGEHIPTPPSRVLEIGCCTGLLTARLSEIFPDITTLYVNDLVPDFQKRVTKRLRHDSRLIFLAGDIEQINIPDDLDLVVSSSTLHWLEDLPGLLAQLSGRLAPGGTLCFSIYGSGNLAEVYDITGIGLAYYRREQLTNLVGSFFDILACDEEKIRLSFNDPQDLLHHLRETGVNALESAVWTRSRLDHFCREYVKRYSSGNRVTVTYRPIYCIARKK